MTKNNLNKNKSQIFKELSIKTNIHYGARLRQLRNLLVLKAEDLSTVLNISTNTIKKAEEGGNVGIEIIGELVLFYGFTLEEFYSLEILPTWEELTKQVINFNKKHKSSAYEILLDRPHLQDLIEFRLLETNLFKEWVDEGQVSEFCKKEYGHNYSNATNTLNNCVKKGWLISDEYTKPKKYKLKKK